MIEQQDLSSKTPREQELELEVARLTAELNTALGEDPAAATSRFLAIAAATVDQVVDDARREADEIAEEISSQAEARRDEATRLATEAEEKAGRLRAEADRSGEVVSRAEDAAEKIREAAIEEAGQLVAVERERVADEIEALTEVRTSLEAERGSLETYHDELSRRVQELAESMVAFMTTEPPITVGSVLENLTPPELDVGPDSVSAEVGSEIVPEDENEAGVEDIAEAEKFAGLPVLEEMTMSSDETDTVDLHSPGPAPDLLDPRPEDAPVEFADLFAPATPAETGESSRRGSLFGANGARLVQQTAPTALAHALDDENSFEDEAFRAFINGDDSKDPSREWLLASEES